MITDLVQIRRLGERERDENERFRKHLKHHSFPERRIRRIAEEFEAEVDCTECANCYKVATARLTDRDIEALSRFLRIRPDQFIRDCTDRSAEEGLVLKRLPGGCVFLDGNACTVYDARPRNCVDFPHTVRGNGSFVSRMWDFKDRACYCPIVYNTLVVLKHESGFHR